MPNICLAKSLKYTISTAFTQSYRYYRISSAHNRSKNHLRDVPLIIALKTPHERDISNPDPARVIALARVFAKKRISLWQKKRSRLLSIVDRAPSATRKSRILHNSRPLWHFIDRSHRYKEFRALYTHRTRRHRRSVDDGHGPVTQP